MSHEKNNYKAENDENIVSNSSFTDFLNAIKLKKNGIYNHNPNEGIALSIENTDKKGLQESYTVKINFQDKYERNINFRIKRITFSQKIEIEEIEDPFDKFYFEVAKTLAVKQNEMNNFGDIKNSEIFENLKREIDNSDISEDKRKFIRGLLIINQQRKPNLETIFHLEEIFRSEEEDLEESFNQILESYGISALRISQRISHKNKENSIIIFQHKSNQIDPRTNSYNIWDLSGITPSKSDVTDNVGRRKVTYQLEYFENDQIDKLQERCAYLNLIDIFRENKIDFNFYENFDANLASLQKEIFNNIEDCAFYVKNISYAYGSEGNINVRFVCKIRVDGTFKEITLDFETLLDTEGRIRLFNTNFNTNDELINKNDELHNKKYIDLLKILASNNTDLAFLTNEELLRVSLENEIPIDTFDFFNFFVKIEPKLEILINQCRNKNCYYINSKEDGLIFYIDGEEASEDLQSLFKLAAYWCISKKPEIYQGGVNNFNFSFDNIITFLKEKIKKSIEINDRIIDSYFKDQDDKGLYGHKRNNTLGYFLSILEIEEINLLDQNA